MKGNWFRIDERENAVDYLEMSADFFGGSLPNKWKWVVIALHGALYSFCVLAIKGTNPDRVTNRAARGEKLISFHEALKRCQSDAYMLQFADSKVLVLSDDEKWAIKKLSDEFRNTFEHFTPKSWSIEVSGMCAIVKNVARIIEFLAFDSYNVRLDAPGFRRTQKALSMLIKLRPEAGPMHETEFVFAYGSNMDPAQMKERCPESDLSWFVAEAVGWELCFPRQSLKRKGGVGSIKRAEANGSVSVWGVVFAVSPRDLDRLDRIEGTPSNYVRDVIEIRDRRVRGHSVWTYFAIPQEDPPQHHTPHKEYIKLYIAGAEYFGLPEDYREKLKSIQTIKSA